MSPSALNSTNTTERDAGVLRPVPLAASLVELATALGSSSSWSRSPSPTATERALPSSAVQLRCRNRPATTSACPPATKPWSYGQ
jgi:hypothetical protein